MADAAAHAPVDDDTILHGVVALKHQLDTILQELQYVGEATGKRRQKLNRLEQIVDGSEESVSDMESVLDKMIKDLHCRDEELSRLESSHQEMADEQAELDKTGNELYHKVNVQDTYLGQVRKLDQEYEFDLSNARFLRDKMREEVEKKEATLETNQHRLEEQDIGFYKQYENLKMDVRRHKLEAGPLLNELNECRRAVLGRLDFYLKSKSLTTEDATKAVQLKESIELTTRHRQAFDQVGDLELEVKNAERVLQYSQAQAKSKYAKIETMDRELAEAGGELGIESIDYRLKSAPRCAELDRLVELHGRMDSKLLPEEVRTVHVGGMGLHKCPKITNIPKQVEIGEQGEAGGQGEVTQAGKNDSEAEKLTGETTRDAAGKAKTNGGPREKMMVASGAGVRKVPVATDQKACGHEKTRAAEESIKTQGPHLNHIGRDSKSTFLVNTPKPKLRTTSSVRTFQK